MLLANFDRKEHLQHRAVSLRQHGFLVLFAFARLVRQELTMNSWMTPQPELGRTVSSYNTMLVVVDVLLSFGAWCRKLIADSLQFVTRLCSNDSPWWQRFRHVGRSAARTSSLADGILYNVLLEDFVERLSLLWYSCPLDLDSTASSMCELTYRRIVLWVDGIIWRDRSRAVEVFQW